jgi:hypothetical protein
MIIGPLIPLRAKCYQRRCVKIFVPIFEDRIPIWRETSDGRSEGNNENKAIPVSQSICNAVSSVNCADFNFPILGRLPTMVDRDVCERWGSSFNCLPNSKPAYNTYDTNHFAVCYVFSHSILDLYGSSNKVDFLNGLLVECNQVSEIYGDLSTSEAV